HIFLSLPPPPLSSTLFPYTTLFRSLFGGAPTEVDATQVNNAWAVFGSAAYDVTKDFKLRAGVRYTRDRKTLETIPISDAGVITTDRKSTRLNSSHDQISYAVFCLKK